MLSYVELMLDIRGSSKFWQVSLGGMCASHYKGRYCCDVDCTLPVFRCRNVPKSCAADLSLHPHRSMLLERHNVSALPRELVTRQRPESRVALGLEATAPAYPLQPYRGRRPAEPPPPVVLESYFGWNSVGFQRASGVPMSWARKIHSSRQRTDHPQHQLARDVLHPLSWPFRG